MRKVVKDEDGGGAARMTGQDELRDGNVRGGRAKCGRRQKQKPAKIESVWNEHKPRPRPVGYVSRRPNNGDEQQ